MTETRAGAMGGGWRPAQRYLSNRVSAAHQERSSDLLKSHPINSFIFFWPKSSKGSSVWIL